MIYLAGISASFAAGTQESRVKLKIGTEGFPQLVGAVGVADDGHVNFLGNNAIIFKSMKRQFGIRYYYMGSY